MSVKIIPPDWMKVARQMQKLKTAQEKASIKVLTKAVIKISGEGTQNAPVKSGTLRRSITQFARSDGKPTGSGGSVQAKVGSKVHYAKYQEMGTRYIKPKKFLYDAIQRNRKFITDSFKQAMRDILNSI